MLRIPSYNIELRVLNNTDNTTVSKCMWYIREQKLYVQWKEKVAANLGKMSVKPGL